jgi:hypothetical protein
MRNSSVSLPRSGPCCEGAKLRGANVDEGALRDLVAHYNNGRYHEALNDVASQFNATSESIARSSFAFEPGIEAIGLSLVIIQNSAQAVLRPSCK